MSIASSSARSLSLTRPLVVFDLETTGVDTASDCIVEIGLVRLLPDGSREHRSWLINPGRPIPPGASAVHGLTDDTKAIISEALEGRYPEREAQSSPG